MSTQPNEHDKLQAFLDALASEMEMRGGYSFETKKNTFFRPEHIGCSNYTGMHCFNTGEFSILHFRLIPSTKYLEATYILYEPISILSDLVENSRKKYTRGNIQQMGDRLNNQHLHFLDNAEEILRITGFFVPEYVRRQRKNHGFFTTPHNQMIMADLGFGYEGIYNDENKFLTDATLNFLVGDTRHYNFGWKRLSELLSSRYKRDYTAEERFMIEIDTYEDKSPPLIKLNIHFCEISAPTLAGFFDREYESMGK